MRQLSPLLGPRDPAQPLLTLLDGPVRVELSGATAANWAAKTANFLDSQGRPERVGVLLPLHWQSVTLLLGITDTGATAVVARAIDDLVGCDLAFTIAEQSGDALEVVDEVVAVSLAPFGGRAAGPQGLPAMVLDAGEELPGHGDHYRGPGDGAVEVASGQAQPATARAGDGAGPKDGAGPADGSGRERAAVQERAADGTGLGPDDRVLLDRDLADSLPALLAALAAGASVLLCPGVLPTAEQLASEGVTVEGSALPRTPAGL